MNQNLLFLAFDDRRRIEAVERAFPPRRADGEGWWLENQRGGKLLSYVSAIQKDGLRYECSSFAHGDDWIPLATELRETTFKKIREATGSEPT